MAKACYYTTLDNVNDVKKYQWKRVINIKKQYEYDGITYLFRKVGIPILRKDLGTTNDLSWSLFTMPDEKNNLGVDILVPQFRLGEACKLVEDPNFIKEAAVLESKRIKAYEKEYEDANHHKPYLFTTKDDIGEDVIPQEKTDNNPYDRMRGYLFYIILVLAAINLMIYGIIH